MTLNDRDPTSSALACWKCGGALEGVRLPLSRRADCPHCRAELHVCRMCVLYNPNTSDRCNEARAEHPRHVDQANFCDWFKPRAGAFTAADAGKTAAARAKLDALFGGTGKNED